MHFLRQISTKLPKRMQMKTMVKFGVAALAMGAFFQVSLPAKAGNVVWVRAQPVDYFRARGLVPPGYYSKNESQKPATVAVSKSGHGIGGQKPASKAGETRTRQDRSAKKTP
jgi:hypothetical protein